MKLQLQCKTWSLHGKKFFQLIMDVMSFFSFDLAAYLEALGGRSSSGDWSEQWFPPWGLPNLYFLISYSNDEFEFIFGIPQVIGLFLLFFTMLQWCRSWQIQAHTWDIFREKPHQFLGKNPYLLLPCKKLKYFVKTQFPKWEYLCYGIHWFSFYLPFYL